MRQTIDSGMADAIVCLIPWQTTVPLSFNCAICGRIFSTNTATQKTCSAACARARKTAGVLSCVIRGSCGHQSNRRPSGPWRGNSWRGEIRDEVRQLDNLLLREGISVLRVGKEDRYVAASPAFYRAPPVPQRAAAKCGRRALDQTSASVGRGG